MQRNTTKPQTKPTVDWEAVRALAIELGAREAARRLGLKESTVLSRAKRDIQTFNQVVISPEQLDQIRALKAEMTSEEEESISRRRNTSEGREKLNRLGTELRERAQKMAPPTFHRRHLARHLRSEDREMLEAMR